MTTTVKSQKIKDVEVSTLATILTGNQKFDEWFSFKGGMVLKSAIFVTGSSGAGKSTLMMNIMNWLSDHTTLLYERETDKSSLKEQTLNLNITHPKAHIADKTNLKNFEEFMQELDALMPKVIIIDSLQAIAQEDYSNMTEEDACNMISARLREWVQQNNAVLFVIGHNTKAGSFAGRNTIMQYMDAHIDMVYHKKEGYRTISWGQKNRKGKIATMYYEFGPDGIEFFTENEYESQIIALAMPKRPLVDSIIATIEAYMLKLSVHPNFDAFNDEYERESKAFDNLSDGEYVASIYSLIGKLQEKHGLIS